MGTAKKDKEIEAIYHKAKESELAGDFRKAEKLYREALAIENNPGTWGILGWVILQKAHQNKKPDFGEALTAAKKMRTLALRYRSKALLAIADCLVGKIQHDAGKAHLAEKYYRESLDAKPRTETYVFLGTLLNELERFQEAKKSFQRAILVDPQNKEAHYNLSSWYKTHEEYESAVKHLQYILEIDEYDTTAMLRLATALWYLGSEGIKEARGVLSKLLRQDPRNIEGRILLAFTYKLLKKFKDAEILFRLTIEQLPADSRAYWAFGYFLANDLKDSAEADFYFQKSIELDPQSGAAHYYYGHSLVKAEREEKGRKYIEKAAELGFDKAQTYLETLREATVQD